MFASTTSTRTMAMTTKKIVVLFLWSVCTFTLLGCIGTTNNKNNIGVRAVMAQGDEEGYYLGKEINAWTFEDPDMTNAVLDAKGLTLSMIYPVSDAVTADIVKYGVYNRNCSKGGVALDEWFQATLVQPSVDYTAGAGNSIQLLNITIQTDPNSFNDAPPEIADQWSTGANGESGGRIQFCLSAYLHVKGDPEAIVSGSETLVTVDYDLTNGFSVETNVDPTRQEQTAEEAFGPTGFFCNAAGVELDDFEKQFLTRAGGELSVCVVPNERAKEAGLGLKRIDNFSWIRVDEATGGIVEQIAIKDGKVSGNGLTQMVCDDDGCGFKTLLMADFYQKVLPPPTEMPSSAPSAAPTNSAWVPWFAGTITSPYRPGKCLTWRNWEANKISMGDDCNADQNFVNAYQTWSYLPDTKKFEVTNANHPYGFCMIQDVNYGDGDRTFCSYCECNWCEGWFWDFNMVDPAKDQVQIVFDGQCATIVDGADMAFGYPLFGDVLMRECVDGAENQIFNLPAGTLSAFVVNEMPSAAPSVVGTISRNLATAVEENEETLEDVNNVEGGVVFVHRDSTLAVDSSRDPLWQQAMQDYVDSVRKQIEDEMRRLLTRGDRMLGTASIGGVGTATVGFKTRRRIYRRNLQGEESWEDIWDERKERFLQLASPVEEEVDVGGPDGITAPFSVQISLPTGPFNTFFDESSATATKTAVRATAATTIIAATTTTTFFFVSMMIM